MAARRRSSSVPKEKITEAELCAQFMDFVRRRSDWVCYPETAGFDVLLAAPTGEQLGIHAKLAFNVKVLQQAIPDSTRRYGCGSGPDYRGILVPENPCCDGHDLCEALGLICFYKSTYRRMDGAKEFHPSITDSNHWQFWNPERRCELPEYIPDVPAGASAPVRLTEWKVGALRILARMEVRGYVTRQDFRYCGIDYRRWAIPHLGWMKADSEGRYTRGPKVDFDKQHPVVYAKIVEETKEIIAAEIAAAVLGKK